MKQGKSLKWHLLIVVLTTVVILQTPFALVNAPRFQQWFLKTYKPFSPWQVQFDALHLKPWRLKVDIANLHFIHPNGHQISAESIHLKAGFLQLLRGRIKAKSFEIKSPVITIAKSLKPDEKQPKKKFKIRTLLLLQNLILDKTHIENLTLHLPEQKNLYVDTLDIKLKPALFGGTSLRLDFHNINFETPFGDKKNIQRLDTSVTTNFNHWSKTFPYLDDVDGKIDLQEVDIGRLPLKKIAARFRFDKGKLASKEFSVQVGENVLLGTLESRVDRQKYSLSLDTPKPITLPEIGSEHRTFNTAGDLTATLHLEGEGFDIKTAQAKGELKASHRFRDCEDHPAEFISQFRLEKGVLRLQEAQLTSDNAILEAMGTMDLQPPALHLNIRAKDFPIERFFEKFEDKNLHPIHGKGTLQGTLDGLGKTIHLQLNGEALEGGYGPLLVDKAQVGLDITQERLKLNGKILSGEKNTGEAEFVINYGPSQPGKPRSKKISLLAKLSEQPLETTLSGYHLEGKADAQFKLNGSPPNDIRGEGTLNASQGSFFGEGFENIKTHFVLTDKRLTIDKADFAFTNLTTYFTKPLTFDFTPGGFKLYGQPFAGLNLDVLYQGEGKRWQINKLTIEDPSNPALKSQASGTLSPTMMDVRGQGELELSHSKFLTKYIREAGGPLQFQLSLKGMPPDLSINGKIKFNKNNLSPRAYPYLAEDLTGTVYFEGNRIRTDDLEGVLGSGTFLIKGWLTHGRGSASAYDLKLTGSQLYYRNEDGNFRMEYDADLALKGPAQNPELSGFLTILDGRYTKNFNIIEELKQSSTSKEIRQTTREGSPLRLNVKVKNLGDLFIDNNVGKIELTANVNVQGTQGNPHVEGIITTAEGEIRYLGLNFDITNGFLQFRDPYINPYLEVDAEQDIADAHITAKLHGRTNNLAMDLAGNSASEGPLEKKDVLSLLLFGTTATKRTEQAELYQTGSESEIAAAQIARALGGPIAKFTHLDVFRLEANPTEEGRAQRLNIGKKLSDRLTVEFASEIKQENSLQTFQLQYWLTDFFLIQGARSTDQSYQFSWGFKFTGR